MKVNKNYKLRELKKILKKGGYKHPKYGDLLDYNKISLKNKHKKNIELEEKSPLFIHVTATMNCNARCRGCINTEITTKSQNLCNLQNFSDMISERDAKAIINLAKKTKDKNVLVCFYGGEPLLVLDKIIETIDILEKNEKKIKFRYMIYTNGINIDSFIKKYPKYAKKIWLYSISIDGQKKQHNNIRRGADLRKIHKNLKALKKINKKNKLMWSTLREEQSLLDCFKEFMYLYKNKMINHFFWHFIEIDEPFKNLDNYIIKYEKGLKIIMDEYVKYLKKGIILPIIHINELLIYLLTNKNRKSSSCGVELSRNYDIVGGRIQACADLPADYNLGYINDDGSLSIEDKNLKHLVNYKKDLNCYDCGINYYCGGRCPVQALTSKPERTLQYCQLIRLHIAVVKEYLDRINKEINKNNIKIQDLYTQSAYYTQFTDVTP